jgi:hypothetical protein
MGKWRPVHNALKLLLKPVVHMAATEGVAIVDSGFRVEQFRAKISGDGRRAFAEFWGVQMEDGAPKLRKAFPTRNIRSI